MTKEYINPLNIPRVGVGIIIRQNGKIILGRRLNEPMAGSWQLPGGWIRFGESPEQAVRRQLTELQGLEFGKSRFLTYTNNVFDQNTHSLSLYFVVDCLFSGQQGILKHSQDADWFWAAWDELPKPLFLPLQILKQSGFRPFKEVE